MVASQTVLWELSKKVHNYSGFYADLLSAIFQLWLAYCAYRNVKQLAPKWCDDHNLSFIEAYVAEGKPEIKSPAQIKAWMKREQRQRDVGLALRTIRQDNKKNSILRVIALDSDDIHQILETQEEIVPRMVGSNLCCQQQCIGTPPLPLLFVNDFGYLANTPAALTVIDGTYEPPAGTDPYMVELLSCLKMPAKI